MVINAAITSWKHVSGLAGDQRPVLGDELVPAPNRPLIAESVNPGSFAVTEAAKRQIKLDRVLRVSSQMLTRFGVMPAVGDRLTVKFYLPGGNEDLRVEIAETRPDPTSGVLGCIAMTLLSLTIVEDGV